MANLKSSKKRIKTNEKARLRNKSRKTEMRTNMKALDLLIHDGKKDEALKLYPTVAKHLDKNVGKGIIQKNFAARHKSNFMKKINNM
ncbi:MAG: 30S ribosomal protein S20 [Mycoplasmatales bacterium]